MRPAFSSIKTASAFALLLLGIFILPVLLRGRLLPPHRESYLMQGWDTTGDYPWLFRQIFEEKGDIDLAFVGSSRIWLGIDTVYVQQQLSAQLGRPAVVRTIAWGGGGYDALYFAMQDLLQNRRVKVLVFNDECQAYNVPNPYARHWFRFGENGADLAGFPGRIQSDYYFAAILGLPRNLLDLLRPNLQSEMPPTSRGGRKPTTARIPRPGSARSRFSKDSAVPPFFRMTIPGLNPLRPEPAPNQRTRWFIQRRQKPCFKLPALPCRPGRPALRKSLPRWRRKNIRGWFCCMCRIWRMPASPRFVNASSGPTHCRLT